MAADVLEHAHRLGLEAHGVSFHVGSQQRNAHAWDRALASAAGVFRECGERGINLSMVNLGGGFPTKYLKNVPTVRAYGSAIFRALRKHFGNRIPETIIEPGRGMVGNAGMIEAEVVLVSKKSDEDEVRWVYLDIGKFGGLAETMDESIRYPIRTPRDGDAMAPCVLAGPTCDSADVLYEKEPYALPVSLEIGDKVLIEGTGRLHVDLLVGRLQRLRAAEDLSTSDNCAAGAGLRPFAGAGSARAPPQPCRHCDAATESWEELTMITIRHEKPSDVAAREALLDAAFGAVRFTKPSAAAARRPRCRRDGLSFVAVEDGRVVGTVRLWDVAAGAGRAGAAARPARGRSATAAAAASARR